MTFPGKERQAKTLFMTVAAANLSDHILPHDLMLPVFPLLKVFFLYLAALCLGVRIIFSELTLNIL